MVYNYSIRFSNFIPHCSTVPLFSGGITEMIHNFKAIPTQNIFRLGQSHIESSSWGFNFSIHPQTCVFPGIYNLHLIFLNLLYLNLIERHFNIKSKTTLGVLMGVLDPPMQASPHFSWNCKITVVIIVCESVDH